MLIENKVIRYPNDSNNIITVWDFLLSYYGKKSNEMGMLYIVTSYFTIPGEQVQF